MNLHDSEYANFRNESAHSSLKVRSVRAMLFSCFCTKPSRIPAPNNNKWAAGRNHQLWREESEGLTISKREEK